MDGFPLLILVASVTLTSGQDRAACDSPPLVIHPHTYSPHEFTSVNYPRPYPRNTHCEWLLEAPAGQKCHLEFVDFQLTGVNFWGRCVSTDRVRIYDGADAAANVTLFGTFCDNDRPAGRYDSRGRHLLVTFESTTINYFRKGIKVQYGFSLCTDAYECVSNPCQNGGTCVEDVCGYNCTCTQNYAGPTCERELPCASSPCLPGTTCTNRGDFFTCSHAPTTLTLPTTTAKQLTTAESTAASITAKLPTIAESTTSTTRTAKQPTTAESTAASTIAESVTTRTKMTTTESQVTTATTVTKIATSSPDDPKTTRNTSPPKTPQPTAKQTAADATTDIGPPPPATPPLADERTTAPTAGSTADIPRVSDSPQSQGLSGQAECERDVWNLWVCGWPWWLILVAAGLGVTIIGTIGGVTYRYCIQKKKNHVVTPRSVAGVHMELTDVDD